MTKKSAKIVLSKLVYPFALFLFIILIGVIGYMIVEGYTLLEALYMTVITISTVGYGEVYPITEAGRAFTIILILLNIGVFSYLVAHFSQQLVDGQYIKMYKQLNMENHISHLSNHVIICGYGRNGRQAAQILNSNHVPFVLIEKQGSLEKDTAEVKYYLQGDATDDEILLDAGIKKARAIVTTLPQDADNLFVVLTAKQLNPHIQIISRATNDSSVSKLKIAGATHVIMPDKIGGAHMASLIMIPDVVEVLNLIGTRNNQEFKVIELQVQKSVELGHIDLWKKSGCTILAVKKMNGEYFLNPTPSTVVSQGESLILMGSDRQIKDARQTITG